MQTCNTKYQPVALLLDNGDVSASGFCTAGMYIWGEEAVSTRWFKEMCSDNKWLHSIFWFQLVIGSELDQDIDAHSIALPLARRGGYFSFPCHSRNLSVNIVASWLRLFACWEHQPSSTALQLLSLSLYFHLHSCISCSTW